MARTAREILNEGNINRLGSIMRDSEVGNLLNLTPKSVKLTVASNIGVLPNHAKCAAILRCFVTAGTATGYFTPTNLATPTTTLVGVNPKGDILFAAADAVTAAELIYVSHEGEVVEEVISVASNSGTLLGGKEAMQLLEVTSTVGTLTGAFTPTTRGATPTTGLAALSVTGKAVVFAAADAVTQARVKYVRFLPEGASVRLNVADKNY